MDKFGQRAHPPSQQPQVFNSQQLTNLFEEFKLDIKTQVVKKYQGQDEKCFQKNPESAENYAKCLYAIDKEFEEIKRNTGFKIFFVQKKIEECIASPIFKANREEGTAHCITQAKKYIEEVFKTI